MKILKYFDVQDHPLTWVERELLKTKEDAVLAKSDSNIDTAANAGTAANPTADLPNFHGLYFLPGREEIATDRWQNTFYSSPRLKKVKKYLKYVRHIPFVAAVAVSGSEAINNARGGSDIDLFILTQPNRMWLARLLITFYFQVLGIRRHGNKIKNRFCLNHYAARGKKINADQNLYTAIEYVSLIPFFGGKEIYEFQKENLGWIQEYLANPKIALYNTPPPSKFKSAAEALFSNPVGSALEKAIGKIQLARIKPQDYIIIQEDELSFHPGSKGQQILQKFSAN